MPAHGKRYDPALLVAPLAALVISIIYGIAAWKLSYKGFWVVSAFGVLVAAILIRNNIKKGWGWHGQRE